MCKKNCAVWKVKVADKDDGGWGRRDALLVSFVVRLHEFVVGVRYRWLLSRAKKLFIMQMCLKRASNRRSDTSFRGIHEQL